MEITAVKSLTETQLIQIQNLYTQLSENGTPKNLDNLLASSTAEIHIAIKDEDIVGFVVTNLIDKIGYREGRVDEIVVDEKARGLGLGKQLLGYAEQYFANKTCDKIEFTSRASREAANKLYQSAGYTIRETNVYSKTI